MGLVPASAAASDPFSAVKRTTSAYNKLWPQLQVVGDRIYYVWSESDGSEPYGPGYWQIWAASMKIDDSGWTASMKTDGSGWTAAQRTTSASDKCDPQLQVVGDNIYYVWVEIDGSYGQIWTASMKTDGTGWSATKRTISAYSKWYSQLQVVSDNIYYCWFENDGSKYQIWTAVMKTDGTGWSATKRTTSENSTWDPQLQVVGDDIHYVWAEDDGYGQIWTASMRTDGTGWSATQRTISAYDKSVPQLQVVGDNIHYVWAEDDGSYYQIWTTMFNLDSIPPPAPSLVSPDNEAVTTDNTPTFGWTSVSDPSGVTYQIQIDDNVDFSSPVYYAINLVDNTHTLPDENALALFVQYFWRVRAVDGVGNVGDWSEEWNFTVVPVGAIGVLLMPLLMLLPFALVLWRQNRRYSMR